MKKLRQMLCLCFAFLMGCVPKTGTTVKTGESARTRISESGVTLPVTAADLYYAHQPQFADYLDTWISFSASKADCLATANAYAKIKASAPVFVPGPHSASKAVSGGATYHHPEYATPLWDLSAVKHGTMYENKSVFVLVDLDADRVYISLRAP